MASITLYSTNCPKCVVLEQRLRDKGLDYTICRDMAIMHQKGFLAAPMLEVDGQTMNFVDALDWLKNIK